MSEYIEPSIEGAWEAFWRYFDRNWMKKYGPAVWNIYDLTQDPRLHEDLIDCTNNPLERYNRQCKEDFGRRPSMMKFISCTRDHASKYNHTNRPILPL